MYHPGPIEDISEVLESIVANIPATVFIKDENGRYLLANENLSKIVGRDPSEMVGKTDRELLPKKIIESIRKYDREILEKNCSLSFEEEVELNGEKRTYYSIRFPIRYSDKYPRAIAGIATDITRKKEVLEALNESEEFFRILLSSISDAVFLTDDTGKLNFICPNADIIFGYNEREIRELGVISKILPGLEFDEREFNKNGEISNREVLITDKHGRQHTLLVNIKKVDIRGATRLYTCRDITPKKEAEEKLRTVQMSLIEEQVALRKKNVALKELINQVEQEKDQIKRRIKNNIDSIITPLIENIKLRTSPEDMNYIDILQESLNDIVSPFIDSLQHNIPDLSPRETEVCNLIKKGFSSKDIAKILGISDQTVVKQRKSIRRKLGISNSKVNLAVYLQNM